MIDSDPHIGQSPAFPGVPIEIEVESSLWESLILHVQNELEREYSRAAMRQGQRLFPLGLRQLKMTGDELTAEVVDRRDIWQLRMTLPVFDWESGYSFIACGCQRESLHMEEQRCAHMWLVQKVLLIKLEELQKQQQAVASGNDPNTPGYSLVFDALDQYLAASNLTEPDRVVSDQQMPDSKAQRIVWFLHADLQVEARLQGQVQGRWSSGKLLSWKDFMERRELWGDPHYRVASHLYPESRQDSTLYQPDALAILKSLLEQDLVFWADQPSEPVEFLCEPLVLKADVEDDALRLRPCLGKQKVTNTDELQGLLLAVVRSEGTVYYCESDAKTVTLVQQILSAQHGLPLDDKALVLDYMLRLNQSQLPVALTENLNIPSRPAEQKIVLRLTPFANGTIKLEMLIRPVAEGFYFSPGSGPQKVLSRSDNAAVMLVRDFFSEEASAHDLMERLALARYGFRPPATWYLPGADAVLSLLETLQSQPNIILEWPKNDPGFSQAWRLAPPLDQQKIALRVGEKKDWLAVQGQIQLDGESVDLAALIKALRENRQYISLKDGRWSKITEALQARLEQITESVDEEDDQLRMNPAAIEALLQLEATENLFIEQEMDRWRQLRRNFQQIRVIDESVPAGFQANFRPYQEEGFRWLHRLCVWGMGACLADDMGLGKTVQTLAVLLKHRERGPSLVIAPTSVIANWAHETRRFAPQLSVVIYRETDRTSLDLAFQSAQLVLVSYGLVLRDQERLAKVSWNIAVIDEAQTIKNAKSQTAKAIQSLNWRWGLALSGTPIENHMGDLWSLFRTISPGLLGTWQHFRRAYGFPILNGDTAARERLRKRIQPFILRRLKKDYLHELPEKIEVDLRVSLSEEERQVYEALRLDALSQLAALDDKQDESQQQENPGQKRLKILGALTRMRLTICHPRLVKPDWQIGSAKLEVLRTLLEPIRVNDHRVLIFSQFTRFLTLVRDFLGEQGIGPLAYLDGQTPADERTRLVEGFQQGQYPVFLISLKAGGTGLNLTKADMVVHLDPWWNPAVEDQATDRAYRMGQKRQVLVYRLIAEGTIEEQILDLHAEKRQLANALLSQDGAALSQLNNDQLIDLIKNQTLSSP